MCILKMALILFTCFIHFVNLHNVTLLTYNFTLRWYTTDTYINFSRSSYPIPSADAVAVSGLDTVSQHAHTMLQT